MKTLKLILIAAVAMTVASCCACRKSSSAGTPLADTKWSVTNIDGEAIEAKDNFYLTFDASEGRFSGKGDCNSVSGMYTTGDAGKMLFSGTISTRAFCPNQELENKFLRSLASVDSYTIDGKFLMLMQSGDVKIVLEAK